LAPREFDSEAREVMRNRNIRDVHSRSRGAGEIEVLFCLRQCGRLVATRGTVDLNHGSLNMSTAEALRPFVSIRIGEQFADLALRGIATPDALARLTPPPAAEHPVKPAAGEAAPAKAAPAKAAPAKASAAARPARRRAKTA